MLLAMRRTSAVKNQLRVLRAMRNWSQADLAEALEVSRQTVNAIETGKHDPSLPLAFRISRCSACRSTKFSTTKRVSTESGGLRSSPARTLC